MFDKVVHIFTTLLNMICCSVVCIIKNFIPKFVFNNILEYITIYYGADITEEDAQVAVNIFTEICPDADVNLINGGQPVYYYLISAE